MKNNSTKSSFPAFWDQLVDKHEPAFQFTLKRHNTENSNQIFPEKELCSLSPNFYIHVSVNNLYIPTIGLPILL